MTSTILQQHAKYSSLENPNYLESELLEIGTIIETVNMLHNYPCKLTNGVGYNAIATLFLSNESYIACASRMQLYIYSGLHK